MEKILFNNLNFVQDGHFSINFNSPLQKSNFYYSEEFEVKEDEQGYYINYSNNKWYIEIPENKENNLIKNDTKIFVLIDSNTASSGEAFIELLKNIENVIFVGTNTSGVLIGEASVECVLPNSKITIIYGSNLRLYNGFTEGVGFEPDIWINSYDSLDRVLKFID